jgi:hypothetical protein
MIRKIFTATIAAGALAIAGPAIAGPGHGGGGGHGGGVGASGSMGGGGHGGGVGASGTMGGGGSLGGGLNAHVNAGSAATLNSQGLLNASPTGIAHANPNSVLARGAVSGTSLPGLMNGLTVMNSAGTTLGTVSQVVTDSSGNIRLVIVTSPTGQTLRLAPSTLSISNNVVTTTSM